MGKVDFYSNKTVTARRQHECEEAGCVRTKVIRPGQQYVRLAGVSHGDFYNAKLCLRCDRMHRQAWNFFTDLCGEDEGPPLGGLLGWLKENLR